MRIVFTFCLAAVVPVVGFSQEKKTPEAETKKVTFEDHVKPIFRQHCFNCHNQGEKKGGLAVDTFGSLIEGGGSGEIVFDDGDLEGSRLWQLVNHDDTPVMPPNQDKLPAEQLAVIRAWIEGGILENSGSKAKAKKKNALAMVTTSGGKPEGAAAMPVNIPQKTPVVTSRASAITALAASPWAPLIAIAGQKQIVLYHSETQELLGILPYDDGIAQSLRFSRDGSFLVVGGGEHSVKGNVAIYDVKTGKRVATVGDELDTVFDADVNDKMTRVALGGPQKMLRIFDATDGELLFDLKKHTDWIFSVAYSPDGVLIASGDRSAGLCVWEAETGRLYLDLTDHKGAIHSLAWRDDSNVLASGSEDGTVKLWDMNAGKAIKTISAHPGGVTSVAFDHQGRVVSAGKDNRAKLWDASGNAIRAFQPVTEDVLELAITHDAKRVVYGDWNGDVFSALAEKPETKNQLAANPPSIQQRIETIKTTLVSVQKELAPKKAALDSATQAMNTAKGPVDAMNAKIAAIRKESTGAEAAAKTSEQQRAAIDAELAPLTNQSRDLEDALTAARVALKSDPAKLADVAAAEEALAKHLTTLIAKRRARISANTTIAVKRQLAQAKKAEADKLATQLPPLQEKLKQASAAVTAAKSAHDLVASRVTSVQQKIARMQAEIN